MHPLRTPTHIWATQRTAQTQKAHTHSQTGKTRAVLHHADPVKVTYCRSHHCRQLQRWNSQRLCLRRFFAKAERKHFLLRLTFLLSAANLMNILYGFYMDLFFLFSYSVPEVPWPRSPVSLMTVGEQSISCTPPNIAQHPLRAVDWILKVMEKTVLQKKKKRETWAGKSCEDINTSSCESQI